MAIRKMAISSCVLMARATRFSEAIWNYSYWHSRTALNGILLVFIEAAIFVNTGDIELDFMDQSNRLKP